MKTTIITIFLILVIIVYTIIQPIFFNNKKKIDIPVNSKRLYKDVEKLCSVTPYRNFDNPASLNLIAKYIHDEFNKLNTKAEYQEFYNNNKKYKNVIASFGPKTGKRIIIGAHYDVAYNQQGADDNASGVAALLEIARLINKLKPKLKYRIDFVAYTLEEPPNYGTDMMGSAIHAKSLKDNKVDVKLMVCLEMLGYYSDEENSQEYPVDLLKWFYPTKGNFIAVVGKIGNGFITRKFKRKMQNISKVDVRSINAPKFLQGIDFSDHRNYWKQGYKAIMVTNTSFYRNKNYHTKHDVIETLDFDKMSDVIKGIYWAIIKI